MITSHWQLIFSGQSLLGGLIGGWLGVELVKYYLGIKNPPAMPTWCLCVLPSPLGASAAFAGLNEGYLWGRHRCALGH